LNFDHDYFKQHIYTIGNLMYTYAKEEVANENVCQSVSSLKMLRYAKGAYPTGVSRCRRDFAGHLPKDRIRQIRSEDIDSEKHCEGT